MRWTMRSRRGWMRIIIGATDSRGWDDTLAKAKAAGIAAIAVDTAIENPVISSLIQTDNEAAAGLAGDWLCQQLGGKGKALVLGGTVGHQTGDARKNGVENKLKACGVDGDRGLLELGREHVVAVGAEHADGEPGPECDLRGVRSGRGGGGGGGRPEGADRQGAGGGLRRPAGDAGARSRRGRRPPPCARTRRRWARKASTWR